MRREPQHFLSILPPVEKGFGSEEHEADADEKREGVENEIAGEMPPFRDKQREGEGGGDDEKAHEQRDPKVVRGDGGVGEQGRGEACFSNARGPTSETSVHVNREGVK